LCYWGAEATAGYIKRKVYAGTRQGRNIRTGAAGLKNARLPGDLELREALREAAKSAVSRARIRAASPVQEAWVLSRTASLTSTMVSTSAPKAKSGRHDVRRSTLPVQSVEENADAQEVFDQLDSHVCGGAEGRLIRDEALGRFTEDEWRALRLVALIEAERRSGTGK